MYNFAILDPRPQGEETNNKIFACAATGVLGVEVTVPALAARCALGNIDPQHTGYQGLPALDPMWGYNDASYSGDGKWRFSTAIQLSTTCGLPPAGATLATVRPDLDSVGAMAVLAIRAEGAKPAAVVQQAGSFYCPACGVYVKDPSFVGSFGDYYECSSTLCRWREDAGLISPEVTRRIWLVADVDNFVHGGWPGPQPLPTTDSPWSASGAVDATRELAAIGAAIADFKVGIADRVEMMKRWMLTGEEPESYRQRVEAERADMIRALEDGSISRELAADGKIAVVVSTHGAATAVGYAMAPVVIALNPAFRLGQFGPHKKFTVCQYSTGYVDLKAAAAELGEMDTGWGGSSIIIGSPQGAPSRLTMGQVVEVVVKHLK